MSLSTSPRKTIPLTSGDDTSTLRKPNSTTVTKRVFYCGVVVEGCEGGKRLPEDIQELVLSLGDPLGIENDSNLLPSASDASFSNDGLHQRKRTMTNTSALADVINELVNTERSYVRRLRMLKSEYADPLRSFSRSKSTAILPAYEAKTLFGNIDNLLPVNEAFLTDLEKMLTVNGGKTVGGVGDVALRHFKELRGFEHYKQYYIKREEAQSIFEREVMKKSSGFAAFIDRIKYSAADSRNRVGLRELLMDPVQRIPRYTLLFRAMVKHMAPEDPQHAKLVEAEEIASVIAIAETDEQTKRAAIMYCLSATIDGFPPALVSHSRRFIDCIDVEDVLVDNSGPSSSSSSLGSLHCTLFLFDDKLMIVKRPGNGEKSGRSLTGLDDLEKLTKGGGLPLGMKKTGMSCKGLVDLSEVVVADVGDADIHIYLENPPQDQTERWSGRPFRALSVVFPPSPVNLDPTRTSLEKSRFLDNLWIAQAKYRTKAGQSVVLCADDREVESRGGRTTCARTYFNVYPRTAFLQESKKTKIVVHIDPLGSADPIPFGINGPPFVIIRVHPMAGEISRYTVTSGYPNDEPEEDIVQTARVPGRIVQTIHQFGLFKFRTDNDSRPSTPTARSRAHIFSLDTISRNLFNARPGLSKGDFLNGSVSNHRRTKSSTSRSSTTTHTTTATDSITKFSHRSNSTFTSVDEGSYGGSRSSSTRRKLVKRGRSSERDRRSPGYDSNPSSRSPSQERNSTCGESYDESTTLQHIAGSDPSDRDLLRRLEEAKRNSQNQHGQDPAPGPHDHLSEETIYEEEPPQPLRPVSRSSSSRDAMSQRSVTPRPESITPTKAMETLQPSRSNSLGNHRRFGPRSPSPLPPKSPSMFSGTTELPYMDDDLAIESALLASNATRHTPSPLPRSKAQSFFTMGNAEATPTSSMPTTSAAVRPLSITKKPSTRSAHPSFAPSRKAYTRTSPHSKTTARIVSPRRVSPQIRSSRAANAPNHINTVISEQADHLLQLLQTTKDDVESSHRAVKRIKLDLDEMNLGGQHGRGGTGEYPRSPSPDKSLRIPQRSNTMTKEAQQRMEEMRQLISKRQPDSTPRSRPRSVIDGVIPPPESSEDGFTRVNESVSDADKVLARAVQNHETIHSDLLELVTEFKEKSTELDKTRVELLNTRRQCELVKSLLADATAEKEIMYEAFNEELDAMYSDVNLPEDEAWTNMTTDLRQTKESKNELSRENSQLKRRLAEMESEREEWGVLLRAHGLIP